jgi:hypothetical protein
MEYFKLSFCMPTWKQPCFKLVQMTWNNQIFLTYLCDVRYSIATVIMKTDTYIGSFTPKTLYPQQNSCRIPLGLEGLGGFHLWRRDNFLAADGNSNSVLWFPAHCLVNLQCVDSCTTVAFLRWFSLTNIKIIQCSGIAFACLSVKYYE